MDFIILLKRVERHSTASTTAEEGSSLNSERSQYEKIKTTEQLSLEQQTFDKHSSSATYSALSGHDEVIRRQPERTITEVNEKLCFHTFKVNANVFVNASLKLRTNMPASKFHKSSTSLQDSYPVLFCLQRELFYPSAHALSYFTVDVSASLLFEIMEGCTVPNGPS